MPLEGVTFSLTSHSALHNLGVTQPPSLWQACWRFPRWSEAWWASLGWRAPSLSPWTVKENYTPRWVHQARGSFRLHKACLCAQSLSCVCQAPLSMGLSRLEWVAISSSPGSSQFGDRTHASCIGRWTLYHWVTQEAPAWGMKSVQLKKIVQTLEQRCAYLSRMRRGLWEEPVQVRCSQLWAGSCFSWSHPSEPCTKKGTIAQRVTGSKGSRSSA